MANVKNISNKTIALLPEKNNVAMDVRFSCEHHTAQIEEGHGPKEVLPDMWLTTLHEVTLYVGNQAIDVLPMLNDEARATLVYETQRIAHQEHDAQ